jgi:predicted ribonuclease YlaK
MRTIYVIDTSTLMDSPKAIEELGEGWNAHIYLHQTVIRELDYHKEKGTPEKSDKARVAAREINKWRKYKGEGPFPVNRSRGSYFHVYMQDNAAVSDLSDRADNKIVGLAVSLKAKYNGTDEILVVSKDMGMQTAAKNHGLWGLGYPFTPLEHLRISEKCDEQDIRSAYRQLLHAYHPDKLQSLNLNEVEKNYAKERLLEIKTAYELLKDNGFIWYRGSQQAKTSVFSADNNAYKNTAGDFYDAGTDRTEEYFREYDNLAKNKVKDDTRGRRNEFYSDPAYSGDSFAGGLLGFIGNLMFAVFGIILIAIGLAAGGHDDSYDYRRKGWW